MRNQYIRGLTGSACVCGYVVNGPWPNIKQKPGDQRLLSQISAAATYMYAVIHGREACLPQCIICVASRITNCFVDLNLISVY